MIRWVQLFVLSGLLASGSNVFAFLPATKSFIEKHCAESHDTETKKGGLDLTGLNYSPEDKANIGTWVKVTTASKRARCLRKRSHGLRLKRTIRSSLSGPPGPD